MMYEIESNIMNCWNIIEDIDIINESVCEEQLSTDELSNILIGLKELYQLKFQKLFNVYEQVLKDKHDDGDKKYENLLSDEVKNLNEINKEMHKELDEVHTRNHELLSDLTKYQKNTDRFNHILDKEYEMYKLNCFKFDYYISKTRIEWKAERLEQLDQEIIKTLIDDDCPF